MLTENEGKLLLEMAREAIKACVREMKAAEVEVEHAALKADSGAFVTIHKGGRLRGCIGTFASPNPLYRTVVDMAVSAAIKDPRFSPLCASELDDISLEISVLSPLKEIKETGEIEVGRHGLYIIKGRNRGVLLPQVAVEHNMDRECFLENTCVKAGLEPDAWKQNATIFTFEAEILKEG